MNDDAIETWVLEHLGDALRTHVPSGLRAKILTSAEGRFDAFTARVARLFDINEAEARKVLAHIEDREHWQMWLPGARLFPVEVGAKRHEGVGALVCFDPGLEYPAHRHAGDELTFVLRGSFTEHGSGTVCMPGDMLWKASDSCHAFRVDDQSECIAAVVLFGGFPEFL